MASGLVVHLEVGRERHTELLTQERIRIGAGEQCDLRLTRDAVPAARDLLLELERADGHYHVADFDPTLDLTHNGDPLRAGVVISDGDKVQLPAGALMLRFFPVEAPAALVPEKHGGDVHVAPFIEQAALEAAATARRDDAKVFLREFTRELIREINPSTKFLVFLLALALVGGSLYLGFAGFKELKQSRRRLEEQNAEIARLNEQMHQSQNQFTQVNESNKDIINSLSLAPKIRSEYGAGVCLISGVYIFVEQGTGRPLRYPEPAAPDSSTEPSATDTQTTFLTPDGKGAIAEFPYVGTGFHVGGGYVLTNRHVAAEPWQADERSMVFGSSVAGKPKLTRLLAYFPGQHQAFTLRLRQVSQRDDLAVCQIDSAQTPTPMIPTLTLDENADAATVGKPVVLMGYPSGPDRILASLPDEDAAAIKQRFGSSLDVLVSHLAERNLIKPLTTQGHITDLETRRIVYDARTGEGGSGAPLFGPSGRVIGVNFAVFTEITDANFAVPIRFIMPLLEKAGWTPAQAPTDAANTNAKETKTAATMNANQQH
jgi:S1-C subfamily serine protease